MNFDYQIIAAKVVEALGGKENISSFHRCATRIKVRYRDINCVNSPKFDEIQRDYGIPKGSFFSNEYLNLIIGAHVVDSLYQAMVKNVGVLPAEPNPVKPTDSDEPIKPDSDEIDKKNEEVARLTLKYLQELVELFN